jgi:hypothetical protein
MASRYQLELPLRHIVPIDGRIYVTRDGLLHVAHLSGQLDGIEVCDVGTSPEGGWVATVTVWRKDMSRGFKFQGRYNGKNRSYGPEMAVKCAEVMALRRAFDVSLTPIEECWADEEPAQATVQTSPQASKRPTPAKRLPKAKSAPIGPEDALPLAAAERDVEFVDIQPPKKAEPKPAPAAKPGEWWADATRFAHPDNDVLTPVSTLAVRAEWHGQSPRKCLQWQAYVCDTLHGKSPEHITTTYSAEQQRWIRTAMQLRKERTAARVVQSREFIPSELDEELAEAEA